MTQTEWFETMEVLNAIEPSCQIVQHFSSHLGILAAGSCWHMKRMIRIPEQLEGCALTKKMGSRNRSPEYTGH